MDSFQDFEARQEARDQAPPGLEGTSPSEWADYVVNSTGTLAENAIANKVNGLTDYVQAQEELRTDARMGG